MAEWVKEEVFMAFTTYSLIVLVKMMLMSVMTSYFRITRGAFANEEDVALKPPEERKKILRTHADVERVRRCHLNDLENVIPFVMIGFFYALSGPQLSTALLHFRVFAGCRIAHTIAYVFALPQPSRGLTFLAGYGVTLSMAYRVFSTVLRL